MRETLTDRGLLRAVIVGFALLIVWRFATAVATVALLLATALLLAVALSAPVEALHRRKIPRPAAVAAIVLLLLVVAGIVGYLLLPVLAQEAALLVTSLPDALQQLVERLRELANRLGVKIGGGSGGISPQTLASAARRVLGGLIGLFGSLASLFAALLVLLFVPLYLAAIPGPVVDWVVRLFPPEGRPKVREMFSESRESLLGWLQGRLFSMVVVGVLAAIALYAIGIPGNLLTPLVMQKAVSLHPVVVIASVTVAGAAFGVLGALLAVPAAVVAGILVQRLWFERLEEPPE